MKHHLMCVTAPVMDMALFTCKNAYAGTDSIGKEIAIITAKN